MLDFTSVLYLGFQHSAGSLRPWSQLTTGVPAALAEPAGAQTLAGRLARLQDCDQAILGRSTLHLFWDLFTMLAKQPVTIYLDAGSYPIAGWGVERAAARGAPVRRFPHRDANTLARLVTRDTVRRRPVIVGDGLCSGCGCAAPVAEYLEIARKRAGLLVLDDTQALGLLGQMPDGQAPYGRGGGGSLRRQAVFGADILLVSSLAKAFGAPLAALSGSREMVRRFRSGSETRVHCSPPTQAGLHAGERALELNETQGDRRRKRLARRVQQFRHLLTSNGVPVTGGMFPVQTLWLPYERDAGRLQRTLLDRGVRTVLRRSCDGRPSVSFVITARHRPEDIEHAVKVIVSTLSAAPSAQKKPPPRKLGRLYMNERGSL